MKRIPSILFASALPLAAHDLFNPVPADQLRDLSADRPDTTESPVTVDAGHYQIEASVIDWGRESGADTYTMMSTNIKAGLTERTDIQLVFDSYVRDESGGSAVDGFGDVTMRLKWNLWGNDGGETALALFPFVKIPTGTALSNDEWEGGLIVPFSMDLAEGWGLGLMAELDLVDDGAGSHEFEFVHTAVLGRDLTESTGVFLEYIGVAAEDRYEASAAAGLTWLLNENLMLDCGGRVGLNDEAEDIGLFTGFTVRF